MGKHTPGPWTRETKALVLGLELADPRSPGRSGRKPQMKMHKQYIGDAVYVAFDGNGLILTTEDGIRATNTIYLEPEVWTALREYVENLRAIVAKGEKP